MANWRAGFGEVVNTFANIFGNILDGGEEDSQHQRSRRTKKSHLKGSELSNGYGENDR